MAKKLVEFVVPGVPVPYVRTTSKQKYRDPQYKRYQDYKTEIQQTFIQARLVSRLRSTANVEATSTTYSKACSTPSIKLPTPTTKTVLKQQLNSFVRVRIEFLEA